MSIEPVYVEFGQWVKERRKHFMVSQQELGEKIGLSRATIANLEAGRQRVLLHHYKLIKEFLSPEGSDAVRMFTEGLLRNPAKAHALMAKIQREEIQ